LRDCSAQRGLPDPGLPGKECDPSRPGRVLFTASLRFSNSAWRPKKPKAGLADVSRRSGSGMPVDSATGSHPTSHKGTGFGQALHSRSPTSVNVWGLLRPAITLTASAVRILAPVAQGAHASSFDQPGHRSNRRPRW